MKNGKSLVGDKLTSYWHHSYMKSISSVQSMKNKFVTKIVDQTLILFSK